MRYALVFFDRKYGRVECAEDSILILISGERTAPSASPVYCVNQMVVGSDSNSIRTRAGFGGSSESKFSQLALGPDATERVAANLGKPDVPVRTDDQMHRKTRGTRSRKFRDFLCASRAHPQQVEAGLHKFKQFQLCRS